jgi:alkanesulfonate monooxygenase SsuD/methylene tetrahydromethanopterin reductase-like flavin-dependent oxidoreductase (luciferase family)
MGTATTRLTVFPDVANLPLRDPVMLARAAATLDRLTGGRVAVGLGSGAFWDGIAALGGPRRTPGDARRATAEAIDLMKAWWSGLRPLTHEGVH